MISYIKGTLVHRGNGVVVVEASGLGYCLLYTSPSPRDSRASRLAA